MTKSKSTCHWAEKTPKMLMIWHKILSEYCYKIIDVNNILYANNILYGEQPNHKQNST